MADCKITEPTVKEVEIPVPWGLVKGKWWGPEDRQPFLAVHGWQDNCGSFDALASLLAPEISLLCIDLPGHGLSSRMPAGLTESSQPSYEYAEMVQIAMDAHNGSLTKQSCETMMKRGMLRSPQNAREFTFTRDPRLKVAGLAMFSKDQVYAYADKISCEYLNIRARPGIKFELPEVYGELMDKIKSTAKRFEYHELPGTHHLHMNEGSREQVAAVVRRFIRENKANGVKNVVEENGIEQ
ncbi:hypothetical protein LSTR_LSTR013227 [Laodelphax striatellus]|uniref:AB hydrolase-1 domain-containing protein n=1 Tax=Laodelphax striatellus TaxID=195883 RepID=A0A482X9P2_LAOST|nr:hypothetical protein LSTR_LSTR013227 [Laodelphax striatellus]